jgi:hypothetical protein
MDLFFSAMAVIISIGSVLVLITPFTRRFVDAPRWMRLILFVAGVLGLIRVGLDIYSLQVPDPAAAPKLNLHDARAWVGDIAIILLVGLMLSPEFRRRGSLRKSSTSVRSRGSDKV